MDLIINEVVELEVVHVTNCYTVVERFTGTSVVELELTVFVEVNAVEEHVRIVNHLKMLVCFPEALTDVFFVCAVEYRSHDLPAESLTCDTEMYFKYLSDVHSRRNAERVKYDIEWCTVREEWHIFLWEDT